MRWGHSSWTNYCNHKWACRWAFPSCCSGSLNALSDQDEGLAFWQILPCRLDSLSWNKTESLLWDNLVKWYKIKTSVPMKKKSLILDLFLAMWQYIIEPMNYSNSCSIHCFPSYQELKKLCGQGITTPVDSMAQYIKLCDQQMKTFHPDAQFHPVYGVGISCLCLSVSVTLVILRKCLFHVNLWIVLMHNLYMKVR